jgi:hypothetical protein
MKLRSLHKNTHTKLRLSLRKFYFTIILTILVSSFFVLIGGSSTYAALPDRSLLDPNDNFVLWFKNSSTDQVSDLDLRYHWSDPLLNYDKSPYEFNYSSDQKSTLHIRRSEFLNAIYNGGSWGVTYSDPLSVNYSYPITNDYGYSQYHIYYTTDPNIILHSAAFTNPTPPSPTDIYFKSLVTGNNVSVKKLTIAMKINYGNTRATLVNSIPYIESITGSSVNEAQTSRIYSTSTNVRPNERVYFMNFPNSDDVGVPSSPLSEVTPPDYSTDTNVYPRINIFVEGSNVRASVDSSYFEDLGIAIPDVKLFTLTNSTGEIMPRTEVYNGLGIWENLPTGSYRVILDSSYLNTSAPEGVVLKPVFFDITVDPDSASYWIFFDKDKNKYCFGSNRLKDVTYTPEELADEGFFESLVAIVKGGGISPGEYYFRCDILSPEDNPVDPSDFSTFSPQDFYDYDTACDTWDISCHLNKFLTGALNKFVNFLKWLFLPDVEFLKSSLGTGSTFMLGSLGIVSDMYTLVESFVDMLISILLPQLDSYISPCNIFGDITFMGATASLNICAFEQAVGSQVFGTLTFMISVGIYFSAILLTRSTFLSVLGLFGGDKK